MKLSENKLFANLIVGTSALLLILIGFYQYDRLVDKDVKGDSLRAKKMKLFFCALDSIGGKKLVYGTLGTFVVIGYSAAFLEFLKQEKVKGSIDFDQLFSNGGKIEFDDHELEIIKADKKGNRYKGYGKLYFNKNSEDWRAVEFSNLWLTFDGKSNLIGHYDVMTPEKWVDLGEDINEIFSNPNYIDSLNFITERVAESGKCPICNWELFQDELRCPNCKSFLRLNVNTEIIKT